jgi:hypothetical protein
VPNPGTEAGSGGSSRSTGSVGASGSNLKPGQPSAVDTRQRDAELQQRSQRLNERIRRGICKGC